MEEMMGRKCDYCEEAEAVRSRRVGDEIKYSCDSDRCREDLDTDLAESEEGGDLLDFVQPT